jgi:hypothetical protein
MIYINNFQKKPQYGFYTFLNFQICSAEDSASRFYKDYTVYKIVL